MCSLVNAAGDGVFIDIRLHAYAKPPRDTVARLNALFEIVVPAVVEAGGTLTSSRRRRSGGVQGTQRPRPITRRP